MLVLFIKVDVKAGKEKEFEELVRRLSEASLKNEKGCLQYNLCKTTEHGNFVILEKYEDRKALDVHRDAAYFKEIGSKLRDCIVGTQRHEMDVLV